MKILFSLVPILFLSIPTFPQHRGMKQIQPMSPEGAPADTLHSQSSKNTVRYDLYISDTTVNYTGRKQKAIAVNGQLPGPTLEFTEGDTAEIYIHNEMMMATSVHWHGLIVPNQYDGVSYLTSPPIGRWKPMWRSSRSSRTAPIGIIRIRCCRSKSALWGDRDP